MNVEFDDIRPVCSHGKDHDHPVMVDGAKQGDELWVWCRFCKYHTGEGDDYGGEPIFCRFVDTGTEHCHECYKAVEPDDGPRGLRYCSRECGDLWDAKHPGYWSPIQDTLPGGRYDGIWEDSGFTLSPKHE